MARIYKKGTSCGVTFGRREIAAFRAKWPASGLTRLSNLYAEFDGKNGDLVDLSCNRRDCHRFDGSALAALVGDMKAVAKRRRCLNGGALGRHRKRRRR